MKKRIVICADGTWNRPEKNLKKDFPTNILRVARAIKPVGADNIPQQVFYDWGVGSYYDPVAGGATGKGEVFLHRSVKQRWDKDRNYRPKNLVEYIQHSGWPDELTR